MKAIPLVTFSIVSHDQINLVDNLISDILDKCNVSNEIVLTLNIPEDESLLVKHKSIRIVRNEVPFGFGANHNNAFKLARGKYFVVLNPDLRIVDVDFRYLIEECEKFRDAIIAPKVIGPTGELEDSARKFPRIVDPIFRFVRKTVVPDYIVGESSLKVDWVAGMFMFLRIETFRKIGGFDEGYFMYYEDADLCRRIRRIGGDVVLVPSSVVVHEARRSSRRKCRYLIWHVRSVLRYFTGI